MVTDKNTLILLSRLANVQLALAESMRGITPSTLGYPAEELEKIAQALTLIEASLLDISRFNSTSGSNGATKLH